MSERIFYIDLFESFNSNYFWRDAFQTLGVVETFDCRQPTDALERRLLAFAPTHIHLGGSVKPGRSVDPAMVRRVCQQTGATSSCFRGDPGWSDYHLEVAGGVTLLFLSNMTHVRQFAERGQPNCRYLPCPTEPSIFQYVPGGRRHDVVYAGWNTPRANLTGLLDAVHERFGLTVAGPRWGDTKYTCVGSAFNEAYAALCGETKIMLSPVGEHWRNLERYFSNRIANTLCCRCFLIAAYTPGMEEVFEKGKHLEWYTDVDNLLALIAYYLENPDERERIAKSGRRRVLRDMTFEKSAARIIADCRAVCGG